nr:hypothetical protein [Tanacetum cinerariifolium]
MVKRKQEKDKIRSKLDKNGKRWKARDHRPIEGRKADYGFVDSVEAEIRRRRAEDIGYGIRDTWIDSRDVAEEEALTVGNKMHKAFPLPGESSHWQYTFPLPVKVVPTTRRIEIPLPGVCTAIEEMMKKLRVKDRWQLH